MSKISRRRLIITGLAAAAGASGLGVAAKLAERYGLIPPDAGVLYGAGETLTYAAQRILTRHSLAREFSPRDISKAPFANEVIPPLSEEFHRMQRGGFADWRLTVDGMVGRPASFSLRELKSFPSRTQITLIACEEGWSYIAEWSGVPLSHILDLVGTLPHVRYVVYRSIQPDWWDSIDMADALHPQTLVTLSMNGGELPVPFGGPVRLRVPRQLGYKNIKYITRLTLTDNLRQFGKGLGSGVGGQNLDTRGTPASDLHLRTRRSALRSLGIVVDESVIRRVTCDNAAAFNEAPRWSAYRTVDAAASVRTYL